MKKYHNGRYFIEATILMIKHAFDALNLHKIYGGTILNTWASTLERVLGFISEGVLYSHVFKNGAYHDVYLIGLLKTNYEKNTIYKEN